MEMKNDCSETFSQELTLPKTISGLNIWPPQDPNVTTRDIYDANRPIGYAEINDELNVHPEDSTNPSKQYRYWCASNRGQRRGNFVVNPEWISEDVTSPPKTVRTIGKVYEPSPVDFHGARDLHAKTWEQARVYPGHGSNPHLAIPGYAPYKHVPLSYRHAKEEIGAAWPWNQSAPFPDGTTVSDQAERSSYPRPRTAVGAYYTHVPEDNSRFTKELNDLHAIHVEDRINGGKPDIETREFTRSNREITYGFNRSVNLNNNPYVDAYSKLPQPFGHGGHKEVTDMFAATYSRNLPQMLFRRAQHAHAPWHAYMTFCDWGEPPLQTPA